MERNYALSRSASTALSLPVIARDPPGALISSWVVSGQWGKSELSVEESKADTPIRRTNLKCLPYPNKSDLS